MAKKKTAKKSHKSKPTKAAKAVKKAPKSAKTAKATKKTATNKTAPKVKAAKGAKAPGKVKKVVKAKVEKTRAKSQRVLKEPEPQVKAKKARGKKGQAPAGLVEVVIAPSNPLLRDIRKEGAISKAAAVPVGKKRCRDAGCDQDGLMGGYCRLHYIKNWRRIKRKEAILASGQLNNYVEELVKKYPDKYLDVIRQDLASEKEWAKVVVDLELESGDDDASGEDEIDPVAEGVRHDRDFDEEDGGF